MRKFRNIPALVTLLAGFVSSVVMIIQKYSLVHFLWVLVAVMAGFYMAGLLLRVILNKAFKEYCDVLCTIPMAEDSYASSFNVSCAASIMMYEIVRQRMN